MRFRLVCIGIVMVIVIAVMSSCEPVKENNSGYDIEKVYKRPNYQHYIYKVKTPTGTYYVYSNSHGVTVLK